MSMESPKFESKPGNGFSKEEIADLEKALGKPGFELLEKKEILADLGLETEEDLKEELEAIEENLTNAVPDSEEYQMLVNQKNYFGEVLRQLVEE